MVSKYILGVDGGNTKTDYFLFDTLGNFIDFHRDVACSHEGLKDSFDGTYRLMSKAIKFILGNNDLKPTDIDWAVFGLAGVDTPYQKKRLEEIVERIGFVKYKVVNDSFLGIKAMAPYGVCSICGTGTSAGGIDKNDNYLQVGGIGETVGDEAGGSWLARRAIRQVYDAMYRFGTPSMLDDFIMTTFGITYKYYLMEEISGHLTKGDINYTEIDKAQEKNMQLLRNNYLSHNGNVELNMVAIDLNAFLSQVIAEFTDKFNERNLKIVYNK